MAKSLTPLTMKQIAKEGWTALQDAMRGGAAPRRFVHYLQRFGQNPVWFVVSYGHLWRVTDGS